MDNTHFPLLVQAAGTVLLFVVFVLLYRKFHRAAFLDWIASWAFFFGSVGLLWYRTLAGPSRPATIALNVLLLAHVFFLLRGVWRFRSDRAAARPAEMLWAAPVLALAWGLSYLPVPEGPISFIRAGAYLITAIAFVRIGG